MSRTSCLPFAVVAVIALPAPVLAHGGESMTRETAWAAWPLTPDIAIPTLLLALLYGVGMVRRGAVTEPVAGWRHAAFITGLAMVLLALQSPIDPLAEHLFLVHQLQHLLLRMAGPMLIALAWPQGVLIAGTPVGVRRAVLAPVLANRAVRAVFGALAHPVAATALFIASLYFWEVPRFHDLALRDDAVHYAMHASMLFAGLLFWWRVFDRRPAPQGARYGVRLMMLWLAILSSIVLGAYTALKSTVLYEAYDELGRLFGYAPLTDEQIGGIIIWIPSSMMCVVAAIIVIHLWGRHETRVDEKRAARSSPNAAASLSSTSASAMIERQRPKNRTLALGFAAFVVTVFTAALLVGVMNNVLDTSGADNEASGNAVRHAVRVQTLPVRR